MTHIVAQALVLAAFTLVGTYSGVGTIANTARKSACATGAHGLSSRLAVQRNRRFRRRLKLLPPANLPKRTTKALHIDVDHRRDVQRQ